MNSVRLVPCVFSTSHSLDASQPCLLVFQITDTTLAHLALYCNKLAALVSLIHSVHVIHSRNGDFNKAMYVLGWKWVTVNNKLQFVEKTTTKECSRHLTDRAYIVT